MKIAIIGSGISGLTCAYYLQKAGIDITVFEKNNYIGGHSHTVKVKNGVDEHAVDTGFIVFNKNTYPNFTSLLNEINVEIQPTDMSFSVFAPENNFQYAGGSLNGLFAQRKNLINPKFFNFLKEIRRFQSLGKQFLKNPLITENISQFLIRHKFSADLYKYYLHPLISALWSSSQSCVQDMPIYFVLSFFYRHALLKIIPDLPWQVIKGGSSNYVNILTKKFVQHIRSNCNVTKIKRMNGKCQIYSDSGDLGLFDKVIVATHSDEALNLLDEPTNIERDILSKFSYEANEVILHTDTSLLPSNKRAWSSWNYLIHPENNSDSLTYYMNRLQNLSCKEQYCVSLNASHVINPNKILSRFFYSHPQYTSASLVAQPRQMELNTNKKIYFCGAYWGYGFHEDGVNSALKVCDVILRAKDL